MRRLSLFSLSHGDQKSRSIFGESGDVGSNSSIREKIKNKTHTRRVFIREVREENRVQKSAQLSAW